MRKLLYFLPLILIAQTFIYSQEEDENIHFYRQRWFYGQRQFPYDSIPKNAYSNAVNYKDSLTSSDGYFLDVPYIWFNIGPEPIANGYFGHNNSGRGSFIKFGSNGNTLFMGAGNGGIWKTTNFGNNWTPITDNLGSLSSGALAIDPNNPDIMYYGTGEPVLFIIYTYLGRGIYKTTNGGENWFQLAGGLPTMGTKIFKIVIDPSNTDVVFAAMNTGLWRSSDEGANWLRVTGSTDLVCTDVVISSTNDNYVYCGGFSSANGGVGYKRSTNNGVSFADVNDPVFQPQFRTELAISNSTPNILYAITNVPYESEKMKIYKSSNGAGTEFEEVNCLHHGFTQVDYDLFLEVSPDDKDLIFAGVTDLFRSTNGGSDIDHIAGYNNCVECCATTIETFNYIHPDFHGLDFSTTNEGYLATVSDGGVALSINYGVQWNFSLQNLTLSTAMLYDFSMYKNNKEIVIGSVQDFGYISKNANSKVWQTMLYGGDGGKILISQFNQNHRIKIDNLNAASLFTINGTDWNGSSGLQTNTIWEPNDGDWIAPLAEHPSQADVLYSARRNTSSGITVFKSTSFGYNWASIGNISGISLPPQDFVIANEPNSNIMYFSASHFNSALTTPTELFRSSNGGNDWNRLNIIDNGIPKRYITDIQIDPARPNIVYLTLSGIGTSGQFGHVFMSTNSGSSWSNISGNLREDAPVNNIVVYYWGSGENDKRFVIASDNGVWTSNDLGVTWGSVAAGLPNTVVNDLELHELSGYLRASTFGRGMWEIIFDTPFFVNNDYLLSSEGDDILIDRDIHVTSESKLSIKNSTLKFAPGTKIVIEEGGEIDVSSGAPVTFTSQSGTWDGIEFQGNAFGTIKNCTFTNTSTPIVIDGTTSSLGTPETILIDSCTFNAPVEVSNRVDVTVEYCHFTYSSGSVPSVMGVICSGSDNALISNNTISSSSSISSTGISVVYGSDVIVQKNIVNNMSVGISISNTSPYVFQNRITNGTASSSVVGIGFDNSYSAFVKQNTVIGFQIGYKMYNSSPEMYLDSSYNTNTSGDSVNGVHAVYLSSPRLKPNDSGIELIWDGGKNNLKTINKGNGIYMYMSSVPILDYGYNFIWGYDNYLFGDGPSSMVHYVRCNDWVDSPPNSGEFNLTNPGSISYTPYSCTPPGGSGFSSDNSTKEKENVISDPEDSDNPPANIIINYGHGVYDTIKVTSGTNELTTADQILYGQAVKEELLGNYEAAITKYKSVIENYQDSSISMNAMRKILNCHEKMNADTSDYSSLRSYYLNLVQNNSSDSSFVKAAKELATKTLVRKGEYASAITEFEDNITGNNDAHEVFCYELNIIETYLIMTEQGDAPSFTGRLASLKPLNQRDGYKKLLEKLYGIKSTEPVSVIPQKFSLSQNYPNPFNPVTKINYSVPRMSKVTMNVYDILGRLVKSLVNDFKDAGNYTVSFDGSSLASGVYFYRIEAGDFIDSKKMVLVK